jgi:hypothetical protein
MRSYAITCEFYRPKRESMLTEHIRSLAGEWEHPHAGMWLVETRLSAQEIRSAQLPHLDFHDRLFVCEAGFDRAEFNALPAPGGKVTQIDVARHRSRLLSGIFSRDGRASRHLKAATARNLRSA